MIQAYVFSGTGNSTVAGFDKFTHDSLSWSVEGRVRTHFFGKTGHQLAGYPGSDANEFAHGVCMPKAIRSS